MQDMPLTAEAAQLLPQAFPRLASLQLQRCRLDDSAAMLRALRTSYPHLTYLELTEPRHLQQPFPEPLWAAAVEEAEASGCLDLLQETAKLHRRRWQEKESRCAAATGQLLSGLDHLTSLSLGMPQVLAAFKMAVAQGGLGARLQAVSLAELDSFQAYTDMPGLLVSALQACTSLSSLELVQPAAEEAAELQVQLLEVLAACPSLPCRLRSLSLPESEVGQPLLDAVLQCLPGEGVGWGSCRPVACVAEEQL